MESSLIKNQRRKEKRAQRVRRHLRGTAKKPRLCVVKTNKHIYVQLINDEVGVVLACLSTCSKDVKGTELAKKNKTTAKQLGQKIAEKSKTLGIENVIFDRGFSRYHGILAELAQGARESGLQF